MLIVGREKLEKFVRKHADAKPWVEGWLAEVGSKACQWRNTHEMKARFPNASILGDNIVIFNMKGNKYRIEVRATLRNGVLVILWVGTHAEYTKRYS